MFKKLMQLSLFFFTGLCACQSQSPLSDALKENIKARIDNGNNVGIVIGVIDGNGVQYFSAGVKSLKTREPVDENSIFEIGSITKTFTGILLADKVIKGEMKLEDPLQKYLPEGINAPTHNGTAINLVHLANHTSSLPRMPDNFTPADPANPFVDYSEKQLYDFLSHYNLTRDIGSQYEYSNYAVGLLGHILATRSGKSYEQLMVDIVAKPLGLEDTRLILTPDMKKNLAVGHTENTAVANWDFSTLAGAGAIRSTAVDMIRYIRFNMGQEKSSLYPAMQLAHKNSRAAGSVPVVGLGWHTAVAGAREIIWHNGGTGGYRTFIGFVKGENKGVVVLSNSVFSVDDIGMHVLNPESPLLAIENFKPGGAKETVVVDSIVLENYVGHYELAPALILMVTRDGTQLKAQLTGQPKFPVFAKSDNVFYYKVVNAQLTFNRNSGGKAESVTLLQGGQQLTGKRL